MLRPSYRWSKHRTFAVSSLVNGAILPLVFLIPPGNFTVATGLFILFGVNMGIGPLLFRSIMADVADEDQVHSGTARTGLFFSLLIMTNKAGYALAIGSVYVLLDWIGYTPGAANSPEAIAGLMNLFVFPTMLASVLVTLIMWNFPLDAARQRVLRAILDERRNPAA